MEEDVKDIADRFRYETLRQVRLGNLHPSKAIHDLEYVRDKAEESIEELKLYEEQHDFVEHIIDSVCAYYTVERNKVFSASRKPYLTLPRHTIAYLLRKHTNMTLEQIRMRLGRHRNHSTLSVQNKACKKRIEKDKHYANDIEKIEKLLNQTT